MLFLFNPKPTTTVPEQQFTRAFCVAPNHAGDRPRLDAADFVGGVLATAKQRVFCDARYRFPSAPFSRAVASASAPYHFR